MCEFISWIEKDNKIYFLTDKMIYHTLKGRELQKFCGNPIDYIGHGAIRYYFNLEGGVNKECTDFSGPKNFPPIIAQAIKDGDFVRLGQPEGVLLVPAQKQYDEATATAWKQYDEATATARKQYYKATATARKQCSEAKATAFGKLFANPKNRIKAWG